MILTPLQTISTSKLCLLSIFVMLVIARPVIAGVEVGSTPTNSTDAEQKRISLFYAAQKDYQEKLRVGQERYQRMQAHHVAMIEEMSAELAARKQVVNIPSTPRYVDQDGSYSWTEIILMVAAIGIGFLGFRHYQKRQV